ncbi:thioesterase domain-containing protein [Paenibacillus sp.]|jgi:surfactin synthase thioesterase subunit|uniref:thioesterase II family protein n=1 Tax=Paenibacillus sp. TaxID=58172 RepID=UPI00281788CB|nr:thioesterase domain-containing protein [Paenibacillus sp.]MDR0268847.1 hypothetical protein [Paenibacillus sp.]
MEKYKLICIPYAGGSDNCYVPLKKHMDQNMGMLSSYFVPILRADYKIVENYNYTEKDKKIPCKMAIFYGADDQNTDENELELWAEYTEKSCTLRRFPGGHFFINESAEEVAKAVKELLEE